MRARHAVQLSADEVPEAVAGEGVGGEQNDVGQQDQRPQAHPEAFGEELPIIQKEFDGFEDTRGRRDSLVLDKDGNLVIIEKKLDDIRSLCGLAGAEVRRLLRESEQFLAPDIRGG